MERQNTYIWTMATMNYNDKIAQLQCEIRNVKRIMQLEDKSQFERYIRLHNELDHFLLLNASEEKRIVLQTIANKYGKPTK